MKTIIDGVEISTNDEHATEEELKIYLEEIQRKHTGKRITKLILTVDGDYLNVEYHFAPEKFERIRRITGYLVGTLERWNNYKRAEEHDRKKHTTDTVLVEGAERI